MGKVSVIVPVYNTEKYLKDCLESIIEQTYENLELILINDGSTDKSLDICKEFEKNDSRVVLKSIENSGVSTARNIGIGIACGEYVMFVDSDDWIERKNLEIAVQNIEDTGSEIAIWSYFKNYVNKEMRLSLIPGEDREFSNEREKEILYLKSIYANIEKQTNTEDVSAGTVMCKLYKRELLESNDIKFNPELIRAEDVVFALNAFSKAEKICYFNEYLYHYRINDSSICNSFRFIPDTKTPFNLLLEEMNEFYLKTHNKRSIGEAINCRTIQVLLWHLKYHYFHSAKKTNIFKVKSEVKDLITKEPYKSAIKNIDTNLIPKQEKYMVLLFRKKSIISYYIIQKVISIRNGNKSNKYD